MPKRNSGAKIARELLKHSKDLASLIAYNEKKIFVGGCGFFVSDIISRGLFGYLGLLHLALGTNR